jgi:hypothetical protein
MCLILNTASLIIVILLVSIYRDPNSTYFRIGPSDTLTVISVTIDTWRKWGTVVTILCILGVVEVIIHEIGMPILGFSIYNPDKTEIVEFNKNELNFLANSMFLLSSVRKVFNTVISITQIDLALVTVIVQELACIFTVRLLLNEKKFVKDRDKYIPVQSHTKADINV